MKKTRFSIFLIIVLLAVAVVFVVTRKHANAPTHNKSSTQTQSAGFNKKQYSNTDPTSLWVIVNKLRPLQPKTYAPSDLVVPNIPLRSNITGDEKQVRKPMATALETMATAAKADGITLNLQSGYRSYQLQVNVYGNEVKNYGQTKADQESARPGYSEHQSGLAADLGGTTTPSCNVEQCFATTPEGKWLAANAYKYGFIVRYPQGKESVTGYEYEPWHVRYIGTNLSQEMHTEGIQTLEEFFGTGSAPNYAN